MKTSLLLAIRLLLLASLAAGCFAITACTTMDPSNDTLVYPTAAEKNQQMQERMSDLTRSFL